MDGVEYIHETGDSLDAQISSLEAEARAAREEARHARDLGLDLEGPAQAADESAARLEAEAADLRRIRERIGEGYPYWERIGFEEAIDACGEVSVWQTLSEAPVPGVIYGHEGADVRLPLDAQVAYQRAVAAGLFDRFEVCSHFDTPVDLDEPVEGVTSDLFGVLELDTMPTATFHVAQW